VKRVVVIGSGGAGKTTFAKRLGNAAGLPVIHLDSVFWKPNWQRTPENEWKKTITELVSRESWIMDGNFGGTRPERIKAADTVIFLDMPRSTCIFRVIKRYLTYRGGNRPDMAQGCSEQIDLKFLLWIWSFPKHSRPRIAAEMKPYPEKRFVILRTGREADDFIRNTANALK